MSGMESLQAQPDSAPSVRAFCPVCARSLHVPEDDSEHCPVCSAPLVVAGRQAEQDGGDAHSVA